MCINCISVCFPIQLYNDTLVYLVPLMKWRMSVTCLWVESLCVFTAGKCKNESLFNTFKHFFSGYLQNIIIPYHISRKRTQKRRCLLLGKASFICLMRLLSVNISCLLVYSGTSLAVHFSHLAMFLTQYFADEDKQWCYLPVRQCQR